MDARLPPKRSELDGSHKDARVLVLVGKSNGQWSKEAHNKASKRRQGVAQAHGSSEVGAGLVSETVEAFHVRRELRENADAQYPLVETDIVADKGQDRGNVVPAEKKTMKEVKKRATEGCRDGENGGVAEGAEGRGGKLADGGDKVRGRADKARAQDATRFVRGEGVDERTVTHEMIGTDVLGQREGVFDCQACAGGQVGRNGVHGVADKCHYQRWIVAAWVVLRSGNARTLELMGKDGCDCVDGSAQNGLGSSRVHQ